MRRRLTGLRVSEIQPFRLLAKARIHLPFQGRYKLLYAPCVASDISTTDSFSRHVACDKLGLSVKGAGIAAGDD